MRANRTTEFVGILGWPLEVTLSPQIHNAAFRRAGLDWVYLSFPVPPEDLAAAVNGLRALGARGANVTMPHKESVTALLDELSGDAKATGAVNTIQELGGRLVGHNTDLDGFRRFVQADLGYDVTGRRALVLGAGGAARAVVRALADMGAEEILVAARDRSKAERVRAVAEGVDVVGWDEAADRAADCSLVANATPVGSGGGDVLPGARFSADQVVVDLIYAPPSTALIDRARASGAIAAGGLGMLVHQAAAAWRIWTGQDPAIEVMSAAAVHLLGTGQREHPSL